MSNACAANALTLADICRRYAGFSPSSRMRAAARSIASVRDDELATGGLLGQHLGDPGRPLEAHERHPAPHGVDGDVRERIETGAQKKNIRFIVHAVEARDLVQHDEVPVQAGLLYLLGQIGRVGVVVDGIVAAADPDKAEARG